MALGDGIRRNLNSVGAAERVLLRDAIKELHNRRYPGERGDSPVGGVSFWFKQDEIHQATHVHTGDGFGGAAFLPWHRELIFRFEQLLREVDSRLSLHYWDFNDDPHALFTALSFLPSFFPGGFGTELLMKSNLSIHQYISSKLKICKHLYLIGQ